jgi:hypothetical protein
VILRDFAGQLLVEGLLCLLAQAREPLLSLGRQARAFAAICVLLGVLLPDRVLSILGLLLVLSVELSDVRSATSAIMRSAFAESSGDTVAIG